MPLVLINSDGTIFNLMSSNEYLMVANTVLAVSGGDAIDGGAVTAVDLVIDGYVAAGSNAVDISGFDATSRNTVYIGENGFLFAGFDGIELSVGNFVVENHGTVTGNNGISTASSISSMRLINHGSITATSTSGTGVEISTGGALSVNYGTITGFEAVDVFNVDGGIVLFDNFGSLIATGGDAINGDSVDSDTIRSFGTITGNVNLEDGDNVFTNAGSMVGDVIVEGGADRVLNSGLIDGNAFLSGGSDVYVGTGSGFVSGTLDLGTGDDNASLGDGGGVVVGGFGDDVIRGGTGSDVIDGGNNNDDIRGRSGADILNGGSGNDFMRGGAGEDQITGGLGADTMFGNGGADEFVYASASESTNAGTTWDRIMDFTQGEDLIDLSAFNARFIGTAGYAANGNIAEVRIFEDPNGDTRVFVDVNADGTSNMRFYLVNTAGITADDFIL